MGGKKKEWKNLWSITLENKAPKTEILSKRIMDQIQA